MKISYQFLFVVFALNLGVYIYESLNVLPESQPMTPYNQSQWEESFNATQFMESYEWDTESSGLMGDIGKSFGLLTRMIKTLLIGFPEFLGSLGAPSILINIVHLVWLFTWSFTFIEFWSGRLISRD